MHDYSSCLLDPEQSAVLIIDEEPMMFFGVESKTRASIMNNVVGLAKTAEAFSVPCILSTIEANTFSGLLYPKLQAVYPHVSPVDRTTINAWEDVNVKRAVQATGRTKLLIAGLWTEACVLFPALCAKADGYDVYVVTDASGGATKEAHDMAVLRMAQAGVKPVTWLQVLLEYQRDWSHKETYASVVNIIKDHGGAYGQCMDYAESMVQKNNRNNQ
ncbi:hydrolase [Paenibacillus aquistagni]|uniref:Nicotinamidase-related amidase n=1 Tax=Paenibacillus aquistagni TaxID=1852522 RepID=A0A1X7IUJ1_9BACL|nr:hydrolase [Paenibacillus aquistagni]SMG18728.1 Nicotinamidase-related amidase [Paenibacillus aquistagni]